MGGCAGCVDESGGTRPLRLSPQARLTASLVSAVSTAFSEVLAVHPINRQRLASGLGPANVVLLGGPCGRSTIEVSDERARARERERARGWGSCRYVVRVGRGRVLPESPHSLSV